MKRFYCTYFDKNYLVRALALINSLQQHEKSDFVLFAVCMDELSRAFLEKLALENVVPIPIHQIECGDKALISTKETRSLVEYYWTATPSIILYFIEHYPEIEILTYLDSDLFFFSSPDPVFQELGQQSILLHEHRFSSSLMHLAEHNGKYNVGLLCFRNDTHGIHALRWWRERCLEWCFTRYEDGKLGDQMYLNDWKERFQKVVELQHIGGGLGPWNQEQYVFQKNIFGKTLVNELPVIFYHFHALRFVNPEIIIPVDHLHYPMNLLVLEHCYVPYILALSNSLQVLKTVMPSFDCGLRSEETISVNHIIFGKACLADALKAQAIPQTPIRMHPDWDCYCPEQIKGKSESVNGHMSERICNQNINSEHASDQKMPSKNHQIVIHNQYQLFSLLQQDPLVNRVQALYVIGAHLFQEHEMLLGMLPDLQHIYLFEPIPDCYSYLKKFETQDSRIKVFPYALSQENGTAEFFLTDNQGESSSLLPMEKHLEIFPQVHHVQTVRVETRRLESVIQEFHLVKPDMLFLDVQGAEYQILSSISECLLSQIHLIYAEASLEELYRGSKTLQDMRELLSPYFDFSGYAPMSEQTPTHGNALFANKGKPITSEGATSMISNKREPLISVIVSTYNSLEFIRECLEDLERQTLIGQMEIIVVDAASPQHERSVIEEFQERFGNIVYIRTSKRITVYAAWNLAIRASEGKYITPFSTNDRLRKDAYEILVRALENNQNIPLVYGDTYVTQVPHETFESHTRCDEWRWPEYSFEDLLYNCRVGPHPMWRRTIHETIGYFDEEYKALGDQDLWLRIAEKHPLLHVPEFTGLYWNSPLGLSCQSDIADPEHLKIRKMYIARFQERATPSRMRNAIDNSQRTIKSSLASENALVMHQKSKPSSTIHDSENSQKRITLIPNDEICGYIRLYQPLLAGNHLWQSNEETNQKIFPPPGHQISLPMGSREVWVTQRNSVLTEQQIKEAQSQGTRIIHDCDDLLWKIDDNNYNSKFLKPGEIDRMFRLMKLADCVTVSTEVLREKLEGWDIQAVVLPNCLYTEDWKGLEGKRRMGSRPRVGWAGQADVHLDDLFLIGKLVEVMGDEVEWVFFGSTPEHIQTLAPQCEVYPMVTIHDFPKQLAQLNLDLALAPLFPSAFNEGKSDLRILQYGMLGYPVIATDIQPYKDTPVTRVSHDHHVWVETIRERLADMDSLEREGDQLREWVLANRMQGQVMSQYQLAWLGSSGRDSNEPSQTTHSSILKSDLPTSETKEHFLCSIVIPVMNKLELTRQCLTSLAEVTKGCSYEVIVVDNASTDGTVKFLSSLHGDISIISNTENLGFAKGCNQGARAATGQYVVFLNNDTIPLSGWLEELVTEVETHQDVAVVGSKLLYPDDKVQHAGVVLSRSEQIPYHIFQNVSQDLLAVNQRREFQAVTAACMLVRKETFEDVGGFDEGYVNGFEDVDLCLKIRQMGKRIIYQPKSCLYHLESQTPGRKKYDKANARRLAARWEHQWLGDEDLVAYQNGYIIQQHVSEDNLRSQLVPIQNIANHTTWQRVIDLQQQLFGREHQSLAKMDDQQRIRGLLDKVEEWPLDIGILAWVGRVCETLGCEPEAMKFWEKLLEFGDFLDARLGLARGTLKNGEFAETQKHLDVLFKVFSPRGETWTLQGILSMQRHNYSEAKQAFEQSLIIDEENIKARMGLGMACMGLGQHAEAWSIFEQVLSINPDHVEAIRCLIQAGTALQRWDVLAGDLTRFVERNPTDCDIRFALAGVQFRAGASEKSKEHLTWLRLVQPNYEGLEDLERLLATSQSRSNLVPVR